MRPESTTRLLDKHLTEQQEEIPQKTTNIIKYAPSSIIIYWAIFNHKKYELKNASTRSQIVLCPYLWDFSLNNEFPNLFNLNIYIST